MINNKPQQKVSYFIKINKLKKKLIIFLSGFFYTWENF